MTDTTANNKRIAKNTLMLYIRMLIMMIVNLYASRIVLKELGVEDFGIYNIVGGIVILFSFIDSAMVQSVQRFLNYALGKGDEKEVSKIFSASMSIYFFIAIIFCAAAETLGLWFVNTYLNIPDGKMTAANIVYQLTIATTVINMIRTPYNAAIIANENMSFYAYVSIIEAVLKLSVIFFVALFTNKLIIYSILLLLVAIIILTTYYIYCNIKFTICKYKYCYDKERYRSILNFSGWSMLGGIANIGANQGLNIILNIFFGVAVNAAMGIANQVSNAVYQFVQNFQTAFSPQIIKSYASSNHEYFISLIINSSKYSFFLLYILVLPILIGCDEILGLWLGTVPEHATSFCQLMLIFSLIDSLQGPLWISAQATGKIKTYQILMSSMILLNLPVSYLTLKIFPTPEIAVAIKVLINILTSVVRVIYLNRLYGFPILIYAKKVLLIAVTIILFSAPLPVLAYQHFPNANLISEIILCFICSGILIYFCGLNSSEKKIINKAIKRFIRC